MSGSNNKIIENFSFRKNTVFAVSVVITVAVIVWALVAGSAFIEAANAAMGVLMEHFDWLYIFGCTFFVIFALALAISPYGKTKLGADGEKPRQSLPAWFAMLFSAGMGVGLVFWGVAEPLSHYIAPMSGIEPLSEEAARFSLRSCFVHWGLHPWSTYAIVGLALGYFGFRLRKESLVSSTLEPVLRKQSRGAVGIIIDVYVAALTVMGVATSFGMGCLQISAGLEYLYGVPSQVYTWAVIIGVVTIVYTWSVVSGIERGMQMLSNGTMILCVVLLVLVMIVGPNVEIVRGFMVGVGDWLANLIQDSVRLAADDGDTSWVRGWRVFYWAWWLSWAPFVGIFLARISRGRSIREFVIGCVVAPTILGMIWFSVFGGAAFSAASGMDAEQLAALAGAPETAPFAVFAQMPLSMVLSLIAIVLLFGFFVTSANSATYVLAMLTSKGNPNPPVFKKIFWGVLLALVAFAFVVSGGVSGIQTIAIIISFPFFFVMLLMCISMVVAIHKEHHDGLPDEVRQAWEKDVQALA
ncbi:MAG: BCCT family transporter [Eggerthellaceae bacterium]|nr:BCCT family transporter [Eggerthellaceae bacterium]